MSERSATAGLATTRPSFGFRRVETGIQEELRLWRGEAERALAFFAPTGYGKTVTMASLYEARRKESLCVWLSCESMVHSAIDALELLNRILPSGSSGESRINHPASLGKPIETYIDETISALNAIEEEIFIFVDSITVIEDDYFTEILVSLVRFTGNHCKFVFSGIGDLDLALTTAVQDKVVRLIRIGDLKMSRAEIEELLGPEIVTAIGPGGIDLIERKTEGWPAALRMFEIILGASEDPAHALRSISGTDRNLSTILHGKVFETFSDEIQQFLLILSHFPRFNRALIRHVFDDPQTDGWFDTLIAQDAFIVPMDNEGERFRLHALFRDYLRELSVRRINPAKRHRMLQRAADFTLEKGHLRGAVAFALAAHNPSMAAGILDARPHELVRSAGTAELFSQWVHKLKNLGIPVARETRYWYIWALVLQRRFSNAQRELDTLLESRDSLATDAGDRDSFDTRLKYLRACIDILSDRLQDAFDGIGDWLATGEKKDPFDLAWAYCVKSIYFLEENRIAEVRQLLPQAEPIMRETDSEYYLGWLHLIRDTALVHEGSYAEAFRKLTAERERTKAALGTDAGLSGTQGLMLAKCAVEMGRDELARALLAEGLDSAQSHGIVGSTAAGLEAAVLLWSGDEDEPFGPDQLQDIADSYPPRLTFMLDCFVIRRLVMLGRLNQALEKCAEIGLDLDSGQFDARHHEHIAIDTVGNLAKLTLIEVWVASRQFSKASTLVESLLQHVEEARIRWAEIELLLIRVKLDQHAGSADQARLHLLKALKIATSRNFIRPFLALRPTIAAMHADRKLYLPTSEEQAFLERILAEVDGGGSVSGTIATSEDGADTCSNVTPRELELLNMISAGLSNQQIGDELELSVGTVKWHLKNLFRKLGASNRSAAAAIARRAGLID